MRPVTESPNEPQRPRPCAGLQDNNSKVSRPKIGILYIRDSFRFALTFHASGTGTHSQRVFGAFSSAFLHTTPH